MADLTQVRVNRFELKHADTDDPVAAKVSWNPLVPGGANFRTNSLKQTGSVLAVERSKGLVAFGLLFALVGMVPVGIGLSPVMDDWVGRIIITAFGAVFVAVGVAVLRGRNLLAFDKTRGVYYRGGKYAQQLRPDRRQQGHLSDLYALQLVSETVSGNKGGSFVSHELNLVFSDGERMNVMDHGDREAIEASAKQLAEFLGIPLWLAVY